MKKYHEIKDVEIRGDKLISTIDQRKFEFNLTDLSEKLDKASDVERKTFVISASGYGIHWPLIDEDLSIDGLLGIEHRPRKSKKKAMV